jgi:putative acetyltransferase
MNGSDNIGVATRPSTGSASRTIPASTSPASSSSTTRAVNDSWSWSCTSDGLGQRRLGHVQPGGGAAKVQLLGDGNEIAQVTKLDIHMHSILTKTNGILEVLVAEPDTSGMDLTIRPLQNAGDAAAFRALNEEWIARYFVVEEQDRRQLEDPVAAYIDNGGEILIAELDGRPVGCVALVPDGTGAYELSKMTISPELRGRGAGRKLLTAAIAHARKLGARSLFLGSSQKLANAVHLYEALGFQHVPPETLHMPYARADVFMQLVLQSAAPPSP